MIPLRIFKGIEWGELGGEVRVRAHNLYPIYVQYSLLAGLGAKGEVLRMGREMLLFPSRVTFARSVDEIIIIIIT